MTDVRVYYQDDQVTLICGDWRHALVSGLVPGFVDSVIADLPYSSRTHEGHRTGSEIRMPTIGYECITEADAQIWAAAMAALQPNWAVTFCDHAAFNWHETAWLSLGWMSFAPVFLKPNPPPRFQGDGPAFALEFMHVARPRKRIACGSLAAYYEHQIGGDRATRTVKGAKPLPLMLDVVRDYSREGDLILDTHCGGGTLGVAAKLLGRRAILIEQSEATREIAARRVSATVREHAGQLVLGV